MIKYKRRAILLSILLILNGFRLSAQTSIEKHGNEWMLMVDSQQLEIKGATFGFDTDVKNYDHYFEELAFLGVNTIRTWGTDENTNRLLDAAHRHGIKVMLGIWMRHGRPGMEADDSFDYLNDQEGKRTMYDNAIEVVKKYKNHPAILAWGIGNEVYLNIATDEEKKAYSLLLEEICQKVTELDRNHPITSVEAWTLGVDWWEQYVPSIDIYGINTYGYGASILAEELKKMGVAKPYIITEFGVRGEWDIEEDTNNVKPEPSDTEKYETIVNGYHDWIKDEPTCLGVYVFHFSSSDSFIGPWLLTHFRGSKRPQYWAIREAYTGEKPINYVPKIQSFSVTDRATQSGTWVPANLEVTDMEQEKLEIEFYYNQRTGSRKRRDQLVPLPFRGNLHEGFEIELPRENGGIKLYATARDAYDNIGIATASITVLDEEAARRRFLVPRASLPFYVYKDNEDVPYSPTAYMGNYKAIKVDMDHTKEVYSGKTAIKISYTDKKDWYGVGLVDPPEDWGQLLGGYDISGAQKFSFWAKASYDNLKVTVGFGLIEEDMPYPDTAKKLTDLVLSDEWTKYTIKTNKLD